VVTAPASIPWHHSCRVTRTTSFCSARIPPPDTRPRCSNVEAKIGYIVDCLQRLAADGIGSFDVRAEVQAAFNAHLRKRLRDTVWTAGGCGSWYLDGDGGTSIMWPGCTWQFRRALRAFDSQAYELREQGATAIH